MDRGNFCILTNSFPRFLTKRIFGFEGVVPHWRINIFWDLGLPVLRARRRGVGAGGGGGRNAALPSPQAGSSRPPARGNNHVSTDLKDLYAAATITGTLHLSPGNERSSDTSATGKAKRQGEISHREMWQLILRRCREKPAGVSKERTTSVVDLHGHYGVHGGRWLWEPHK